VLEGRSQPYDAGRRRARFHFRFPASLQRTGSGSGKSIKNRAHDSIKERDPAHNQPTDHPVKRGTVFHERFEGSRAVPFLDDGYLSLQVWRKEDAGGVSSAIRFGIAISIEAGEAIPVYDEIAQRLRITPRP
jgi:hypothetical protein